MEKELNVKGVLNRTQFGFRKGKGTIEAIYVLTEIIEENTRKEKGKIYVCFTDLKAAFDRLNRKKIWERREKKLKKEKRVEERRQGGDL